MNCPDPDWIREFERHLAAAGSTVQLSAVTAAQHTYSPLCDGLHPPGPCPTPRVTNVLKQDSCSTS